MWVDSKAKIMTLKSKIMTLKSNMGNHIWVDSKAKIMDKDSQLKWGNVFERVVKLLLSETCLGGGQ